MPEIKEVFNSSITVPPDDCPHIAGNECKLTAAWSLLEGEERVQISILPCPFEAGQRDGALPKSGGVFRCPARAMFEGNPVGSLQGGSGRNLSLGTVDLPEDLFSEMYPVRPIPRIFSMPNK